MSEPCFDLDDVLSGPEPDWDTEPPAIDSATAQAWMYRLAIVHQNQARITHTAASHREQVDAWERRELGPLKAQQEWLERSLTAFRRSVRAQEAAHGQKRLTATLSFPSGRIKSRSLPGGVKWCWEAEGAELLAWAVANGRTEFYEEKPRLSRAAAREVLRPLPGEEGQLVEVVDPLTGEKVPGVHAEVCERTYTVDVEAVG